MGNQPGKQHQYQAGRPKKMVHWKSAERPSPPGRPILIPLSDQQPDVVSLRWERPKLDGGSAITGYVVEHRRMGSPHWVRATPTPVIQCEISISGLEPGWRYQFRAFAENIVGRSEPSELSDPLTVTLQRNAITVPRFTEELSDMNAVEDERLEFRVGFLGLPPPEINWFKDGYEIFSSRRTKIINENDVSVLVIHQVALTDEGEIKCTATNRAGHVITKAKLMVQAPPKIRLPRTYEDGLIVEAGEVLRLKVGIAGQPPPIVTWMHEGEVVPTNGRFEVVDGEKNSMLKVDNISRDDRGEYSVRVSNKLGEDVASFLVTVTARPNPPGRVRLNMSFGKSATLSWTAPIDDGGCKIGNYIVEYFRGGWNVWLKATTTRSLSTTLHDLIEGSEYRFRVKAENPYGVSDPSEESEVLFIPDPKRGITKPKSTGQLKEDKIKPHVPRRKAFSPPRKVQDASTETMHISPRVKRKPKPELIDTEDLQREMSYGTPDQALRGDIRKSPSMNSNDSTTKNSKPKLTLKIDTEVPPPKSPQRSPRAERSPIPNFLTQLLTPKKDKTPTASPQPSPAPSPLPSPLPSPRLQKPPLATPERSATPDPTQSVSANHFPNKISPVKQASNEVRKPSPVPSHKSATPPDPIKVTPALQRSSEPVALEVNQHVRRFSGQALSPARNVAGLAIAIATSKLGESATNNNEANTTKLTANGVIKNGNNGNRDHKQLVENIIKPTIQISAPTPAKPPSPPPVTTPLSSPFSPLLPSVEKHDDVHTSNEFMLVVFDKHSKVKDKDKQDSFELDLEEAIQPPPISISSPDLASLEFTHLHTFPLRRSVSSTELLYERAMARFYEAVELEEAEKARKHQATMEKPSDSTNGNLQASIVRKRLGSISEAERLSFERRSELRRQSADHVPDLKSARKWSSREDVNQPGILSRTKGMVLSKQQESQESPELSDDQKDAQELKNESFEVGSDYTESTASSDHDSIEKFKMELMARTASPEPTELETYHPRNMSAGVFTPYRTASPEEAAVVLNRPMPLPSPDFVPKPILKRSSNENMLQSEPTPSSAVGNPGPEKDKLDITKGIKSFFKRDKRTPTERNTEENQNIASLSQKPNAAAQEAEIEAKRRARDEEERKRKEAESLMMEEAHAAVDHYSDLVRTVSSTRKYHTPLYLDREELKKAAEKASREGIQGEDDADDRNVGAQFQAQKANTNGNELMPPVSNRRRLSISERVSLSHVRDTASALAMTKPSKPDTPSEDGSPPQFPLVIPAVATPEMGTETVISETTEERPDSRGRNRLVKVKRIIKKRVPSGSRSKTEALSHPQTSAIGEQAARGLRRDRGIPPESKSPDPLRRKVPPAEYLQQAQEFAWAINQSEILEVKSVEQISEEAHEKVRSALSYSTDLMLFMVACYVYIFKDARLVLPILALLIYRQMGEAISRYMPNWMKRKKD